jgi:hypothetical protein
MSYTSEVTVYQNGRLSSGHRVSLGFSSLLSGGTTSDYSTDSNGIARIQHASTGEATVYVDGNHSDHRTKFSAPGKVTVYL